MIQQMEGMVKTNGKWKIWHVPYTSAATLILALYKGCTVLQEARVIFDGRRIAFLCGNNCILFLTGF